jgi:hypothetical protein
VHTNSSRRPSADQAIDGTGPYVHLVTARSGFRRSGSDTKIFDCPNRPATRLPGLHRR